MLSFQRIRRVIRNLPQPLVTGWRKLCAWGPHSMHADSDTEKFTVALHGDANPPTRTAMTIFRDDQPRFRTLSAGKKEEIKRVIESGKGFRVRIGRRPGTPWQASQLVEKRYGRRGYQMPTQWDDPNLFTFMVHQEGALIGTVGIRFDSANGLGADKTYPEAIKTLRQNGHRISEFTRLAVETTADSITAMCALFHSAYLWASVVHDYDYCVIEVVPRHIQFYQRLLGFTVHGEGAFNNISHSAATLLGISFKEIAQSLKSKRIDASGNKDVFQFGFSEEEAAAIVRELQRIKVEREAHALSNGFANFHNQISKKE